MYAASDISPFVRESQSATDFFAHTRGAFGAIRKSSGYWAAYLVAPFAVGLFWFVLWSFRRKLRNLYSNEVSLQDYKKTRLEYDLLNKILEATGGRDLTRLIKRAPWLLKGSLRLVQDIFNLVFQRKEAIGHALEQLDTSAPHTDLLRAVSEKELWASRAKVYDYRF